MRPSLAGVLILTVGVAVAAEGPREPTVVLNSLADRLYVAGETTGKLTDMLAAEEKAADEIRQYIGSGSTEGLLAHDKSKQAPLAAAAYMGYPNVVAALLTSKLVAAHINDADTMGVTPWVAATLSMRQSIWSCNPGVFDDPYKFVPLLVTQAYYLSGPQPPYKKTRAVLEQAGALPDASKAKSIWLTTCKNQSEATRTKVESSADVQKTLQELAAAELTAHLVQLQKNAAQAQQKH